MAKCNPKQGTFFDDFAQGIFVASPKIPSCGNTAETRETSEAAADAIRPRVGTLRAEVLAFIESRGSTGATDAEIQAALGLDGSTQRPRRIELVEAELIKPAGKRSKDGRRPATVWVKA